MTPEEYLRLENATPYRSEYYDGAMLAMTDRTHANATINGNLLGLLHYRLRDTPWQFFSSSMRVLIDSGPIYTYPDASVTCRPPELAVHSDTTLINPVLIFEVLAPSGESCGRRATFQHFQKVKTLQGYVVIAQDSPHIGYYSRLDLEPYSQWFYTAYAGLDAVLPLSLPGVELPLVDIYEHVEFPPPGVTTSQKHPDHDRIF